MVVLFNLCALTDMGNHKNSFMGMWALRPSLFSLFSEGLRPSDRILARHFPAVSHATIKALEAHSRKHNHFLTSSSMVMKERESSPLLANINPSTASHLSKSFRVMTEILAQHGAHGRATAVLCLDWARDVVDAIVKGQMESAVFRQRHAVDLFAAVIAVAGAARYEDVVVAAMPTLTTLALRSTSVPTPTLEDAYRTAVVLASSTFPSVVPLALKFLKVLPYHLFAAFSIGGELANEDGAATANVADAGENDSLVAAAASLSPRISASAPVDSTIISKAIKRHVAETGLQQQQQQQQQGASPPPPPFHALNFRVIMGYILFGHLENQLDADQQDWLEWLYHSCRKNVDSIGNDFLRGGGGDGDDDDDDAEAASSSSSSSLNSAACERNKVFLWNWACWESAQFCIANKLRSPLGKALDTFTAVENVLKAYAFQLKQKCDENDDDDDDDFDVDGGDVDKAASTRLRFVAGKQQRVRALLLFVDHLEKQLYNAFEGCAFALPAPNKIVKTFFRTNKSSCQEWVHRNRLTLMIVSLGAGNPHLTLWHGNEFLREYAAANGVVDGVGGGNNNKKSNNYSSGGGGSPAIASSSSSSTKSSSSQQSDHLELALILFVKALIRVRAGSAVLGLYHWCKKALGKKFSWFRCLADKAAGQDEQSCHQIASLLTPWMKATKTPKTTAAAATTADTSSAPAADDSSGRRSPGDELLESLNSLEQGSLFTSLGMDDDDDEDDDVVDGGEGKSGDDDDDEEGKKLAKKGDEEGDGGKDEISSKFGVGGEAASWATNLSTSTSTSAPLEPTRSLIFLGEELLDSYLAVGDWSAFLKWQKVVAEKREKTSVAAAAAAATSTTTTTAAALPMMFRSASADDSYVAALSSFSAGDFAETCRILAADGASGGR